MRSPLSACEVVMDAPCSILSGRVSTHGLPPASAASILICDFMTGDHHKWVFFQTLLKVSESCAVLGGLKRCPTGQTKLDAG